MLCVGSEHPVGLAGESRLCGAGKSEWDPGRAAGQELRHYNAQGIHERVCACEPGEFTYALHKRPPASASLRGRDMAVWAYA